MINFYSNIKTVLPQYFIAALMCILLISPLPAQQVMVSTLTPNAFNGSGGISVGEDGRLYVGDFGIRLNNANGTTIKRVSMDGTVETFASGLAGASGNSFDSQGLFYQSNIAGNRVSRVQSNGSVSTLATGVTGPVGLIVDSEDIIFATNCTTPGAIDRITQAGQLTQFVSSNLLSCPNGLTIDDAGNLYTCNFNNGWVVKITPGGQVSNFVNIPGGAGSNGNNGHITFANGRLYVVARCANQIYEVSLTGQRTLLAGSGARGNADGPALQATFSIPNGIRASRTGDTLFVNDAVDLTGGCFNGPLNPVVIRMVTGVNPSTAIDPPAAGAAEDFYLEGNYPNPFNPETVIGYSLSVVSGVTLKIYDTSGREVRMLVSEEQMPGSHSATWDGRDNAGREMSSGVYLYRLTVGMNSKTRKMTLIR